MEGSILYDLDGAGVFLVGKQAGQSALIWWLTEKTGSAAVLTTSSLVPPLPEIALGPLVGALIGRWSRRWTMIVVGLAALGPLLVLSGIVVLLMLGLFVLTPSVRNLEEGSPKQVGV